MISRNSLGNIYPIKKLGDVADFLDSRRKPVKECDRIIGPYPYYGANGLQGWINDFLFDENLILLAEDGGHFDNPDRGVAYKISGKTWVNNHAHVIKPKKGVDLDYLCRVLENYDLTPWITGTTRGKLTKGGASEILIPLPPLAEQRRIATILDQADELRQKRQQAIEKLDQLLQATFIDMFGDPVSNPKGWRSDKNLGDVADIVSGITKGRKITGKSLREIPYLAVSNVQDKYLNLSIIKTIEASDDEIERYRLKQGDLLLTEGGDPDKLGRGTLWNNEVDECIHQNHVFRVRLTSKEFTPNYLNWIVGSEYGKRYFLKSAKQTTGIASINMGQLKKLPLLTPPLDLQIQFDERCIKIHQIKNQLVDSYKDINHLFSSLQNQAFNGTL